ncbi:hypothetical protein ACFFIS_15905 [Virgibacillus soli]|uniref:Uncharacterized protein n=1 Tax=Paracerasibacillus soli TaxID=480284 RepID=A0ABU5CW07_9BACI|nr:hypothetical protein [Virgibacillus soli]MDY0410521.1 hypothetical protein [Virgibacillus soli]
MSEKKLGLKGFFSKSKKDCCSIEIEETKNNEDDRGSATEQRNKQKKDA